MMDITSLFKSTVRKKISHSKSLGLHEFEDQNILKRKVKCEYILKFKDLVKQISRLRDFLLEHRKSYMKLPSAFTIHDDMSEMDRDRVDKEAQFIIKTCSQLLSTYKKDVYNIDSRSQELENRKAIIDLIDGYLKTVCKIYTEQKAIRVKLTVEMQKMSKLESNVGNNKVVTDCTPVTNKPAENDNSEDMDRTGEEKKRQDSLRYSSFSSVNETEENALSEEEMQMFEMENQQLYNELNSLNDEVRDIQSKVIKIAELQEVFTEKVLEQNEEIERISTTVVGSTENLKDANAQIRQAIQSNATLRIYILFFLLVMSFSLLFLDWYND